MIRWGLLLLGLSQVGRVDLFLIALCISLLQALPLSQGGQKGLFGIGLGLVFLFPELTCYFGLWAYGGYPFHPLICLFSVLPALFYADPTFLWGCIWLAFGWQLGKLEQSYLQDHTRLKHQRDDFVEKERFLAEQNARLEAEKQYEIEIARLQERNRIARDLHDSIGHVLSSSLLQVGALQAVNQDQRLEPLLQTLSQTLDRGMHSARQSLHDLEDASWDFDSELQRCIHQFQFCPLTLHQQIDHPFSTWQGKHVIAIINEALHNVTRHSKATRVQLTLSEQPGFYQLIIADNGPVGKIKSGGMGLANMQERVQLLKGHWNLDTQNGFKIHISWPKEEKIHEDHDRG